MWTRQQKTVPGPLVKMKLMRPCQLWRKENIPNNTMRRIFWYSKLEQMWQCPKKVLLPAKLCWHSQWDWTQPPSAPHQSSPLMLQRVFASIYSPMWNLRRSSPHCWGQPLEESLISWLWLQTISLLVPFIYPTPQDRQRSSIQLFVLLPSRRMELAHSTPVFIPSMIYLNCRHSGPTCGHVRDCSCKKIFSSAWTLKASCQNHKAVLPWFNWTYTFGRRLQKTEGFKASLHWN